MSLVPGQALAHYSILAPLGAGAMGEVYRARDTRLDRDVAIKILPQHFAADIDRLHRFEREAKTLATLNHPGVAQIYGVDRIDDTSFLVLEHVPGETLEDRLRRGPLPIDDALDIGRQIAAGVEAAHEAGVIHRDLKPANVRITPEGAVKVLDFGLAKPAGPSSNSATGEKDSTLMTAEGMVLGTPTYMSPEQARGRVVDRRTDVWAFGCLLFECLTGRLAFGGDNVGDVVADVLHKEPPWEALPRDTPHALEALLRRCLDKDAHTRLRDIGEARVVLAQPGAASATGPTTASTSGRGRERLAWIAALVLLALVLVWARGGNPTARGFTGRLQFDVHAPRGVAIEPETVSIQPSPDGSKIAFVANPDAERRVTRIFIQHLDSQRIEELPGTDNGDLPFWSPDGKSLGFFGLDTLMRIDLAGGQPRTVCAAPSGRGGAWSEDGRILFSPNSASPLFAVPATGGSPVQVTELADGETAHRYPQLLPDGRHFLYVSLPASESGARTMLGSLDGAAPEPVVQAAGVARYTTGFVLFDRGGAVLAQPFDADALTTTGDAIDSGMSTPVQQGFTAGPAVAVSSNGIVTTLRMARKKRRLLRLDRSGRNQGTLAVPAADYGTVAISPDGKHASVTLLTPTQSEPNKSDLWILDLMRDGYGTPLRLLGDNEGPVWSPTSDAIAFKSMNEKGLATLVTVAANGDGAPRVLTETENVFTQPLDWSRDGRHILLTSLDPATERDLWVLPVDAEPLPLLTTRANEYEACFSPDGKWIAYRSDESGSAELYVRPFNREGEKHRVSRNGAGPVNASRYNPRSALKWRSDGKEILFVAGDGMTVMAAPVELEPTLRIEEPQPLFELPPSTWHLAVDDDCQEFLAVVAGDAGDETALVVHIGWLEALATR